jgi:hypothetical protein
MALLVATLVAFVLAGAIGRLERGFLVSLRSASLWRRAWVFGPALVLAVLVFALTVAAGGVVGIALAFATGILAFETWAGTAWYHSWASGMWLGKHRGVLHSHPDLERQLGRSKIGRFLAKRRD